MVGDGSALLELLRILRSRNYRFTTVTPETHARVVARPLGKPADLRDIFGWNRAFAAHDLDREILNLMKSAAAMETLENGAFKSRVRIASLDDDLYLHSSFPTDAQESVFFGPDTYRFVAFLDRNLDRCSIEQAVDMGAGTGAGGIAIARRCANARVTLVDTNPRALEFAQINAAAAGIRVEVLQGARVPPGADLVVANPPYMMDDAARSYRDGGALLGGAVALDWVKQTLGALRPGGRMLLYTGAAYVAGRSPVVEAITQECQTAGADVRIESIDPDVFGEELEKPAYAWVERIAAVGIAIQA